MRRLWIVAVGLLLAGCSLFDNVKRSDAAVERFHRRLSARDYDTMYAEADSAFRVAVRREELVGWMDGIRPGLGRVTGTSRTGWRVKTLAGGKVRGTYALVTYSTKFERGTATESLVLRVRGDRAYLVRYNIKPAGSKILTLGPPDPDMTPGRF